MKKLLPKLFQSIFWIWNLTFLTVVYLGILPQVGVVLIEGTFRGFVSIDLLFTLIALITIPSVCSIIGYRLRTEPNKLIRLFYGVEAPFFLLCLLRLFLIREITTASAQILGTIIICVLAFLIEILYGYAENHRTIAWIQLICHCFMLVAGIWVGLLLTFYVVPLVPVLIVGFFKLVGEFLKFDWVQQIRYISPFRFESLIAFWWISLSLLLCAFTATLFVAMPFVLAGLYIQSYRRILLAFAAQYGAKSTYISSIAIVTAWTIIFTGLQQQPQIEAFKLLQSPPTNDRAQQALLADSNVIRQGLVNAYLSSYRYLSSKSENNHISEIYKTVLLMPDNAAWFFQNSYNYLMSPFLYQGKRLDVEKAEKLYAEFFDLPIQKAERTAIQHALQSTYNRDEAKAGLLNINQQKVLLAEQKITVKPQSDWADIELYEVYENQTSEDQEVFYSFSLPESAVITGLWLGNSDKLNERYPFVVSPRGAAQKVYTEQVQRQVDPALLEQVGTRHYRLRAFPIPAKTWREINPQQPTKLHLWLTYKVMQQQQGWALPQLGEKRNVFWTNQTQRVINDEKIARFQDNWLPAFIPTKTAFKPQLHQVSFTEGYRITAKPLNNTDTYLPQNQRFAIILDGSRSMGTHSQQVKKTFAWLQAKGFADNKLINNDADLYITSAVGAKPQRIDDLNKFNPDQIVFYGTVQFKQMLEQFNQLRGNTPYDAILLVTDEGSYELSKDESVVSTPSPLWMVHLGGKLPPAYDDATLKAMQDSRGGVATEISEVIQRIATQAKLGESTIAVVDNYAWQIQSLPENNTIQFNPDNFAPVAARYLVQGLSKQGDKLAQLDSIHGIAKKFAIATPYSSMIVLVNDRQKEALKKAEQASDRFNRTVETGKETLTKPSNPLTVSGVPEPEEWMLIGIAAIALILISKQKKLQKLN